MTKDDGRHPQFAIRYSQFAIRYSLFAIRNSQFVLQVWHHVNRRAVGQV